MYINIYICFNKLRSTSLTDDMIKVLVANIHVSAQNEIIISSITSMNG